MRLGLSWCVKQSQLESESCLRLVPEDFKIYRIIKHGFRVQGDRG